MTLNKVKALIHVDIESQTQCVKMKGFKTTSNVDIKWHLRENNRNLIKQVMMSFVCKA